MPSPIQSVTIHSLGALRLGVLSLTPSSIFGVATADLLSLSSLPLLGQGKHSLEKCTCSLQFTYACSFLVCHSLRHDTLLHCAETYSSGSLSLSLSFLSRSLPTTASQASRHQRVLRTRTGG